MGWMGWMGWKGVWVWVANPYRCYAFMYCTVHWVRYSAAMSTFSHEVLLCTYLLVYTIRDTYGVAISNEGSRACAVADYSHSSMGRVRVGGLVKSSDG